jgi:hypothetical protein
MGLSNQLRSAAVLAGLLAGCQPTSGQVATPPGASQAGADLPSLEKEGRVYAGPVQGGRGGQYKITLCPDGKYTYLVLDAHQHGTWKRSGNRIELSRPGDPASSLTLSADERSLDQNDMKFQSRADCKP